MIEDICTSKRVVKDLRDGPLGPNLERLGRRLERISDKTEARHILLCAGRFVRFAEQRGTGVWNDDAFADFLLEGEVTVADAFHASRVRTVLRDLGLYAGDQVPASTCLLLIADYDAYLRDARGVTEIVRRSHAETVRKLLSFHRRKHGHTTIEALSARDVLEFFHVEGDRYRCVGSRQKFAGELRQVLRFMHLRGIVAQDLASTVPLFVNYRLSTVPNYLPWDAVRRLITSVDTRVAPGKRDRAILLLVACLGLRPRTVCDLMLQDIHWRQAEIRIPRTKSRRGLNLPLSDEVGEALSAYVLEERPESDLRTVFLRHAPPRGPFASSSAITSMINTRLTRAGIPKLKGAGNLLRHSLATQLVNAGVSIKHVSDVFGHSSIDTTAIYTKVDLRSLSKVPMPFALGITA